MKPKDAAAIISEIQKYPSKLSCFELALLKSSKLKISRDENTTPNMDRLLLSTYERVTDAPRSYRR